MENIFKKYLTNRRPEEEWSCCVFPQKRPSVDDLQFWNTELATIATGKRVAKRLREFTASIHKIWEWRFCSATERVLYWRQEVMEVYIQLHRTGMGRHPIYFMETEGVEIANSK